MKLLIFSMSKDGEVVFRVNQYKYRAWIDTTHYPEIRKYMYRKPGHVLNLIKKKGRVKRIDSPNFSTT